MAEPVGDSGPEEFSDLLTPSSLLSSTWSLDNLVTSLPARLYTGQIQQLVSEKSLGHVFRLLQEKVGPVRAGRQYMGQFTWDIACEGDDGPFILQFPLALDKPGARTRARSNVPQHNVENMRYFIGQGLTRFVTKPIDFMTLGGALPVARFTALSDHHRLTFGRGSLQVTVHEADKSFLIPLGPRPTADLLAEMVAALTYHYDADNEGGIAITDVYVNDGDFSVRRRADGSFSVRLMAVRQREAGISPELLLLYLLQMVAYESFWVDGALMGIPVVVSNPGVAFEGLVRGRSYRQRDLGLSEQAGEAEARRWIHAFGHSNMGRSYRPWVERFLAGRLALDFGEDLRERWWRLAPLQQRLNVLELLARQDATSKASASANTIRTFLERLSKEIGCKKKDDPHAYYINDLSRERLLDLLKEADVGPGVQGSLADAMLLGWPYRSWASLVDRVAGAGSLGELKSRIFFGNVIEKTAEGKLEALLPVDGDRSRPVSNAEVFGGLSIAPSRFQEALKAFPTFEAYMDAALHDEQWGYYGHAVSIGKQGHFNTHPESLSPHYGKWMARWAFKAYSEMLEHGELGESDAFSVVEFGAGNGRLARDFLDAIAQHAESSDFTDQARFRAFASKVQYRIYEMSESLRKKQQELLGRDAVIAQGDARRPQDCLKRDFPDGVRGLLLSNEVLDTFGHHKLVLGPQGLSHVALVVPRVEQSLVDALDDQLPSQISESDRRLRQAFGFEQNQGDFYLDSNIYSRVMSALAGSAPERREKLLSALWFEEAYVPVTAVDELAAHLRKNAAQYATALAAENSGVVVYVNLHANAFIAGLASSLRAGYILTLDYGDSTFGLIQGARRGDFRLRIYGDVRKPFVPRPNDPYNAPGTQDMTVDVNCTDLAQAAQDAGLFVIHFGLETDLAGDDLPRVLAASEQEPFDAFVGNPVFKILVLGKRASSFFDSPLRSRLSLFCNEKDVAESRRQRISMIEGNLNSRRYQANVE